MRPGVSNNFRDTNSLVADLTAKVSSEDDTIKRLTAILAKESKRVGSETITAALQQKRIDDQMRRYVVSDP